MQPLLLTSLKLNKSVGKDCIPNKPTVCQSGIKPLPTKKEFLLRASIIAMVTSPKEMSNKQRSGFVTGLFQICQSKMSGCIQQSLTVCLKDMLKGDMRCIRC